MTASAVLTLRVTPALLKKLNKLSKATDRTRSRLAVEALEAYVDDQAWQVAAIEEGVHADDAGDVVPEEDVVRWVKSWGSKRELPKPKPKKR